MLLRTAQTLEKQIGIINEIRVRTADPMSARLISERIGEQTGYKSISWQEAQEDLLSAITLRNVLMYTIVGAILLVASFGTFNIVATITHEKTRDIAILKSLGFRDRTIRAIFMVEALIIGLVGAMLGWGLGYLMTRGLASLQFKTPFSDQNHLPVLYSVKHYALATAVALSSSLIAGYFPARAAAVFRAHASAARHFRSTRIPEAGSGTGTRSRAWSAARGCAVLRSLRWWSGP